VDLLGLENDRLGGLTALGGLENHLLVHPVELLGLENDQQSGQMDLEVVPESHHRAGQMDLLDLENQLLEVSDLHRQATAVLASTANYQPATAVMLVTLTNENHHLKTITQEKNHQKSKSTNCLKQYLIKQTEVADIQLQLTTHLSTPKG